MFSFVRGPLAIRFDHRGTAEAIQAEPQALGCGFRFACRHGLLQCLARIGRPQFGVKIAMNGAGQVEQIVNQPTSSWTLRSIAVIPSW